MNAFFVKTSSEAKFTNLHFMQCCLLFKHVIQNYKMTHRSSRPEVFLGNVVLKISSKFTGVALQLY